MATSTDLEHTLSTHPMLFDDGFFMNQESALQYYNGNTAKMMSRRAIPLDEFQASVEWLEQRKLRKDVGDRTSHEWKQVMERATRTYVSEGAFVGAALFLGIPLTPLQDLPHPLLGLKDQKGDF